jgi:hypothetical protein
VIYEITNKVLSVAATALDPTPQRVHTYHTRPPTMNCSMIAAWVDPAMFSEVFPTPSTDYNRCEETFLLVTVNLRLIRECWPIIRDHVFPAEGPIEAAVLQLDADLEAMLCALKGAIARHELSTVPALSQPKAAITNVRAVPPLGGFAGWDLTVVVEGDYCCA